MSLTPGTRIGSYEVTGSLGAGGMGEVFRARDTRLHRDVAIKVLPAAVAEDADRLARFTREAQTLAALNHPNIAAIYGLEEGPAEAGPHTGTGRHVRALVMELVEGQDLSDLIRTGAGSREPGAGMPLDEALPIARQIAAALETAHEQGIVHRDLKPANIKVRADGTVKVLDFGLAKAMGPAEAGRHDAANSPTFTAHATAHGVILGTAAYMSPEQARGKPVDKRADIWAFGVVLYEMLSGHRLFDGGTASDSIAAVLTREPDWSQLPAATPPRLIDLLRRCLRKDAARRLRDIGDAAVEIDDLIAGTSSGSSVVMTAPAVGAPPRARGTALPWALAAVMTLVAGGAAWFATRVPEAPPTSPAHVALPLPSAATIYLGRGSSVAVSPDGTTVVFPATADQRTQLYVRTLDRMDATPLPGTTGAVNPFFSPDGQWVGFSADGRLKKVRLQGGAVITVTDAPNIRGEAWGADDTILFVPSNGQGIFKVPAGGGTREPVTTLQAGELSHRWPQFVPGGRAILFTIWNDTGFEGGRIAVERLDTHERKVLVQGGGYGRIVIADARHAYLVYAQAEGLMAAPFDLDRLELTGAVTPLMENVSTNLSGGAHFAFSATGLLAFLPGTLSEVDKVVAWVDCSGKETVIRSIPSMSMEVSVSHDGRRAVRANTQGPDRDIFVEDLDGGTSTRLTAGGGYRTMPILTADGRRVVYAAGPPNLNLFWRAVDGSDEEVRLTTSPNRQRVGSFSPDGRTLAYVEWDPIRNADIWLLPLTGDRTPRPFLQTPASEGSPQFSPDGQWLAYQSNTSGRFEVFIAPLANPAAATQVSSAGGTDPRWSASGKELFYLGNDGMMVTSIELGARPAIGAAQTLFATRAYLSEGDLARDTGRFLMVKDNGQEAAGKAIFLVMHWFDELKSKVPSK